MKLSALSQASARPRAARQSSGAVPQPQTDPGKVRATVAAPPDQGPQPPAPSRKSPASAAPMSPPLPAVCPDDSPGANAVILREFAQTLQNMAPGEPVNIVGAFRRYVLLERPRPYPWKASAAAADEPVAIRNIRVALATLMQKTVVLVPRHRDWTPDRTTATHGFAGTRDQRTIRTTHGELLKALQFRGGWRVAGSYVDYMRDPSLPQPEDGDFEGLLDLPNINVEREVKLRVGRFLAERQPTAATDLPQASAEAGLSDAALLDLFDEYCNHSQTLHGKGRQRTTQDLHLETDGLMFRMQVLLASRDADGGMPFDWTAWDLRFPATSFDRFAASHVVIIRSDHKTFSLLEPIPSQTRKMLLQEGLECYQTSINNGPGRLTKRLAKGAFFLADPYLVEAWLENDTPQNVALFYTRLQPQVRACDGAALMAALRTVARQSPPDEFLPKFFRECAQVVLLRGAAHLRDAVYDMTVGGAVARIKTLLVTDASPTSDLDKALLAAVCTQLTTPCADARASALRAFVVCMRHIDPLARRAFLSRVFPLLPASRVVALWQACAAQADDPTGARLLNQFILMPLLKFYAEKSADNTEQSAALHVCAGLWAQLQEQPFAAARSYLRALACDAHHPHAMQLLDQVFPALNPKTQQAPILMRQLRFCVASLPRLQQLTTFAWSDAALHEKHDDIVAWAPRYKDLLANVLQLSREAKTTGACKLLLKVAEAAAGDDVHALQQVANQTLASFRKLGQAASLLAKAMFAKLHASQPTLAVKRAYLRCLCDTDDLAAADALLDGCEADFPKAERPALQAMTAIARVRRGMRQVNLTAAFSEPQATRLAQLHRELAAACTLIDPVSVDTRALGMAINLAVGGDIELGILEQLSQVSSETMAWLEAVARAALQHNPEDDFAAQVVEAVCDTTQPLPAEWGRLKARMTGEPLLINSRGFERFASRPEYIDEALALLRTSMQRTPQIAPLIAGLFAVWQRWDAGDSAEVTSARLAEFLRGAATLKFAPLTVSLDACRHVMELTTGFIMGLGPADVDAVLALWEPLHTLMHSCLRQGSRDDLSTFTLWIETLLIRGWTRDAAKVWNYHGTEVFNRISFTAITGTDAANPNRVRYAYAKQWLDAVLTRVSAVPLEQAGWYGGELAHPITVMCDAADSAELRAGVREVTRRLLYQPSTTKNDAMNRARSLFWLCFFPLNMGKKLEGQEPKLMLKAVRELWHIISVFVDAGETTVPQGAFGDEVAWICRWLQSAHCDALFASDAAATTTRLALREAFKDWRLQDTIVLADLLKTLRPDAPIEVLLFFYEEAVRCGQSSIFALPKALSAERAKAMLPLAKASKVLQQQRIALRAKRPRASIIDQIGNFANSKAVQAMAAGPEPYSRWLHRNTRP